MLNLSDKELDRLSREAAEHYDPDTSQLSWDSFAPQLDKELGSPPPSSSLSPRGFHFSPLVYTGTIMMLAVSSYFFLKKENEKQITKEQIQNKLLNATIDNKNLHEKDNKTTNLVNTQKASSAGKAESLQQNSASIQQNNAGPLSEASNASKSNNEAITAAKLNNGKTTKPETDAFASSGRPIKTAGTLSPNHLPNTLLVHKDSKESDAPGHSAVDQGKANPDNSSLNDRTRLAVNQKGTRHLRQGSVKGQYSALNKNKPGNQVSNGQGTVGDSHAGNTDPAMADLIPSGNNRINGSEPVGGESSQGQTSMREANKVQIAMAGRLGSKPLVSVDDSVLREALARNQEQAANANQSRNGKTLQNNRALVVGIGFAPDLTTANSSPYYNKVSTNYELSVGYYLAGNLSINSGITLTKKHYLLPDGDDFNPPNRWFNITGTCNMIEIPLTLRYDFPEGKKTNLFINGGFSSYLMRSENYDYYYHSSIGPNGISHVNQTYNTDKNYWFSVVNISAGLEQYISRSLSIQFEPFIKIPVKGVGMGNVQLSSYGMSFTVRYAPLLKQSRR